MRFEVSRTLDAIEQRLSVDPALARGVLDLAEIVHYVDLDGGRAASMLRLGMVIDALARHLNEENVPVYVVAGRTVMADNDLVSNERMAVRRWADDGLIEVLPNIGDRVLDVAETLAVPVLTRGDVGRFIDRYPWLGAPGRLFAPVAGAGGAALVPRPASAPGVTPPTEPPRPNGALLGRLFRCPEQLCAAFGPGRLGRPSSQPPPRLVNGVPTCPRHEARLADIGPRPAVEIMAVRIDGVVRQRFPVAQDQLMVVGRAPEQGGVMLGQWLPEEARSRVSRSHLRLELHGDTVVAVDMSTNGTLVRRNGSAKESDQVLLRREQRVLAPDDVVELYPGVQIGRANNLGSGGVVNPSSVMADAPTISLRAIPS